MRGAVLSLVLLSPAAAWAQTTVSGNVTYEDKMYTLTGFTGVTRSLRVRLANFEIVRASDGTILANGTTDTSGNYGPSAVATGETVFLRVYAQVSNGTARVVVKDNPVNNATYTAASGSMTLAAGANTLNLAITIAGGGAPVFNIFDMGILTFQYLATLPGFAIGPTLTFYWFSGSANGTFFDRNSNGVFLLGSSTDPDEFDDDVILHECGHWVAFNYSKDDTPGGPHTVTQMLDIRLSWSEGWAHYWSATVRRYAQNVWGTPFGINRYSSGGVPASVDPWVLVDNFSSGASAFDIQTPSFSALTITAQNEIAVAYGLWHITTDLGAGLENTIFQAVTEFKTLSLPNTSLEKFQLRWLADASGANYLATFGDVATAGIYKSRQVRYYQDGSESNNSMATAAAIAVPSTTTQLTFFPAGNNDWFRIITGPGILRAETLNLGDGCDTVLELYDAGGTLLASNDDRSLTDPSSLIQFNLPVAGTYFIHVFADPSPGIVQYGTYDLSVSIVLNLPPTVTLSATNTQLSPPGRVTFTVNAADADDSVALYEWDFEGTGVYGYTSIEGGTVTHTYERAGTYNATVRVTDSRGSAVSASTLVTVGAGGTPSITVNSTVTGSSAPMTATFTINVSGTIPVSYEFDFEGSGVATAASVVSNSATFVYRLPGAYSPRFTVHDIYGRAYQVVFGADKSILVSPGASPPSITSFTAAGSVGTLPFTSVLSIVPAGEAVTLVEWDPYGRGRFELTTLTTTTTFQYQRVGKFTAKARATFTSGRQATATTTVTTSYTAHTGWLVEPRAGDRLAGTAVTLTAEAVPKGTMKKVQFQYRQNAPVGPWINIGGPLFSANTVFSTTWDVSGFAPLSAFDLRILIDDVVSSGDTSNTITINPFAPDINESATSKQRVAKANNSAYVFHGGASIIVPTETHSSDITLTLSFQAPPQPNGSALEMTAFGQALRVDGSATFTNNYFVRLPLPAGAAPSSLEIHWFDETAGQWRRDYFSDVKYDDGLVEVRSSHGGVFAVFQSSLATAQPGGGGGGGGLCGGSFSGNALPFLAVFLILGIARCSTSRSSARSS